MATGRGTAHTGTSCCSSGRPQCLAGRGLPAPSAVSRLLQVPCRCQTPFAGKKKKKKKAKARGDDDFGGFEEGGEEGGERGGGGLPWEGSDRDYTYEELLGEPDSGA